MPRNGSGTFSIANGPFTVGSVINPDRVNENFTDVAAGLTGSLPRDGQAAMTGPLKVANGTVTVPSIAFSADVDTGFYWVSEGVVGFAANGVRIFTMSDDGVVLDNPPDPSALIKSHGTVTGGTETFNYNDAPVHTVVQDGNVTIAVANLPDGADLQINLSHLSGTLTFTGITRWVVGVDAPEATFAGTGLDPAALGTNTTFTFVFQKFGSATLGYVVRCL